jgi:ribosome-associated protein
MAMRIDKMKRAVVSALEDIKARDIEVLDVKKMTSLFDCIIIASADSTRQTKALAHHVQEKLRDAGALVYGMEGEQIGEWVLIDLGRIVVHIMQPAVRAHYNLEQLWSTKRNSRARA